ncbi:MAG: FliA/WhiG family RNA polymerase sigma factor [Nocardioidaceae bacterium]|nr:FliA/WhiG family RNA polymerase sigma factor [Nocardioidaceae bacterium]
MVTSAEREDSVLLIWKEFHRTREPALRNRLVMQYSPLVKYVAGRMRTRLPESVEQDDLVSDGVLGLMDAIERFDPGRGLTFQTFAVPRIRGSIIDGMRAMDFVPRSVRDKLRAIQQAQVALEARLGRIPENAEVAAETGLTVHQVRDLTKQASGNHANLDDVDLADELSTAADTAMEQGDVNASLRRVVDELSERDRVVIALYYYEGLTLAEIGRVLGVTESRISQVHSRATSSLKSKLLALESA